MTTGKCQIKGDDAAEIQRREVAAVWPAPSPPDHLLIRKHDKSDIVGWLSMGTALQLLPTTELVLSQTEDDFCSHILINQSDGSRVRVIDAVN